MRFVATIAWWLGLTSIVLAQNVVGTPISKLPAATAPLSGAELFPLVQGGVTKQAPVNTLWNLISPTIPAFDGSTILLGPATANPYGGTYQPWMYGIGGSSYPDTGVLATNILQGNGSIAITNPWPYGNHNTADAGFFATGGSQTTSGTGRPGVVSGYTAPSQVSTYFENGAAALSYTADTQPVAWNAPGTFTSMSFIPAIPIPQFGATVVRKGMYLKSSDIPPYIGQVTSISVNGSNSITLLTVSGWYQLNYGIGSAAGTPAGSSMYMNPQDFVWSGIGELNLNHQTITCDLTISSNVAVNCSSVSGLYPNGQFVTNATYLPAQTYLRSVDSSTQITLSANALSTHAGASLSVSNGSQMNSGVIHENDVVNTGEPVVPLWITGSATTTSGSYIVTGITSSGGTLRPNLTFIYNSQIAHIMYVNPSTGDITLDQQAPTSGSITFIAETSLFEGGVDEYCLGVVNDVASCFLATGNMAYSFESRGATTAGFYYRPGRFGPNGPYGFRVDTSFATPTVAPFSLGNHTTDLWDIDGSGNEAVQTVTANVASLVTGAASTFRWSKYQTGGVTRWFEGGDNSTESGSNTGTNFFICRANDAGSLVDCPLQINRQFGSLSTSKAFTSTNYFSSSLYHLNESAAPTATACGTTPVVDGSSTNESGYITTGTGTPAGCTLTFANAFPVAANCAVTAANAAAVTAQAYVSSSAGNRSLFSLTQTTPTSGASYTYICKGK